jgi:phosphoglycolate phosphatase
VTADRPPYRVVLFDFDGTLADSYDAIAASVNHVRERYGLLPLPVVEVRRYVGRGVEYLLARTVPGGDPARDAKLYRAHHPHVMRRLTRLMPGAGRLLDRLRGLGMHLGVCSNKPLEFTCSLLESLGIASRFDAVLGPEDVPRPKPAPDMIIIGLDRLGAAPAEALYVGDMTIDVTTARAAGVAVWALATGSDTRAALEAAGPDRLFKNLDELSGAWLGDPPAGPPPLDSAAAGG